MRLNRDALCRLMPHAGAMCLLDGVADWNRTQIECWTRSHRDPNNPLRRHGALHAVHGVEYGAQAAAAHGGLLAEVAGRGSERGYLAAVRDLTWTVERLDTIGADLIVRGERIHGDAGSVIYRFAVAAAGRPLVTGRVTVVLRVEAE